jgi:hypothetical protein
MKHNKPVAQIRETEKRYGKTAIFVAVCIGLVFILFDLKPIGKGLILGSLFSVLNLVLMAETLPFRLGVSRNRATLISGISILIRYALLAIPLLLSLKTEQFNLTATICGLFMIQILILADQIRHLAYPSRHEKYIS